MKGDSVTPMMKQYHRIKGEMADDVILFFRLGDFYEMFYDDAKAAAPILDIALTKRNDVPMCGVPYHALDAYLAKLIQAGKKVAICDQVEDATAAKGVVKREVTRVVTPGTILEERILEGARHNFLACVHRAGDDYGAALMDLSTGFFQGEDTNDLSVLRDNLRRFSPTECVVSEEQAKDADMISLLGSLQNCHVTACDGWQFEYESSRECLVRHFGVKSLEGFGCEGRVALVGAAGGILHYVKEDLRRQVGHIRRFRVRSSSDFLVLDAATCGNLELVDSRDGSKSTSLLGVLDATRTSMGSRKLREWIVRPLAVLDPVVERHDAVSALHGDRVLLGELREALGGIRDVERLVARLGAGGGNARDIRALGQSLDSLPAVRAILGNHDVESLRSTGERVEEFPELVTLIEESIVDEPPATVRDGGMIRDGYSPELDELRQSAHEGRTWLAEYQASEQERTGIKNIKVRHNKVFGYYIEVSKGQLANVPEDYVRKQTLVNAERFITPQLKEFENKIFGASEKAIALEYDIFVEVRGRIIGEMDRLQAVADVIAELDVLGSLADRALSLGYVRPTMTDSNTISIKQGRHPVVEQVPGSEQFVPNDTMLDGSENQLIIITGPNMAGKSTYIRQVAVIVIMAHIGSFVPAEAAEICLVDRVFTRVGASDDLAGGRSTFMVEMEETANILNNATPKSLIVLDEIGRGTSTFDGISIAWAVAEYLHNKNEMKAKTLFATHYHELTDLAIAMPGVKNYNVLVRERNDRVVFLRRIVPGCADKSYGIQVARLAGMPAEVVGRAKEILANLEEGEFGESGQPKIAKHRSSRKSNDDQLEFGLSDD